MYAIRSYYAYEEIGLTEFKARPLKQYLWESDIEREYVFAFVTTTLKQLKPDGDEVEEGKFWSIKEVESNLGKGIFTPNFEHEFQYLKKALK